jgi:hypothetical protein
LIEIGDDGKVRWHGEFVCIGSGGLFAWAMMSQGVYLTSMPLMDCMAQAFFAKRIAERDPYVGTTTSIMVDVRGRDKYWISDAGEKLLNEKVKIVNAPTGLAFDPKVLERIDDEQADEAEKVAATRKAKKT